MADQLDPDALVRRFADRSVAARDRALPPVAGAERGSFLAQQRVDVEDFGVLGAATATLDEGVLELRLSPVPADVDGLIARLRERAAAVRARKPPPVAGAERDAFIARAQQDFMDYAIVGDATVVDDGDGCVLRVDLRRGG